MVNSSPRSVIRSSDSNGLSDKFLERLSWRNEFLGLIVQRSNRQVGLEVTATIFTATAHWVWSTRLNDLRFQISRRSRVNCSDESGHHAEGVCAGCREMPRAKSSIGSITRDDPHPPAQPAREIAVGERR